jgi:hypothetical protein
MAVVARAITYATLFVGFVLVYLPGQVLSAAEVVRPAQLGLVQLAGGVATAAGAVLAAWCILASRRSETGPPRRSIPRAVSRNPMYLGAALAVVAQRSSTRPFSSSRTRGCSCS